MDRLTRNQQDYIDINLEKTGIEIHFVREGNILSQNSSPSDFFMKDMQISMAAWVSRNISSEAKKGMKAKAEAGLYPSCAPVGYVNTTNTHGVRLIEPDPVSAPLVKHMYELYSTGGVAVASLAKELYSLGLRSHRGSRISISSIHRILRNPIYRGRFLWNGVEYKGKHESIVSAELWFNVQDTLAGRSVQKPKQQHAFAYTGIMQCGHCGCAVTAERRKQKYSYYHCTGFRGKHGEPYLREEKLDIQFSNFLLDLRVDERISRWILGSMEKNNANTRKILETARERLYSQRKRLLKRSDVLYDDRLDGRIDVIRYDSKSAEIRREMELIDEKLTSIESSSYHDPLATAKGILELTQNAHSLFLSAPAAEKKQLLQRLLSNCTLANSTIKPELKYPLGLLYHANIAWKSRKAVSSSHLAIHPIWHPEQNSNLGK
jgi:DNA invertase Pin-like site-specific DNA recombinase